MLVECHVPCGVTSMMPGPSTGSEMAGTGAGDGWWDNGCSKMGSMTGEMRSMAEAIAMKVCYRLVSFFSTTLVWRDYHIWKPSSFPVFFGAQMKSHSGRDLPAISHNRHCDPNYHTWLRVSRYHDIARYWLHSSRTRSLQTCSYFLQVASARCQCDHGM